MPPPPTQKLEINRLIEYSVDFSLCQRLNASFDWIFNGFGRFLIGRSIFARGLGPTGPGGPAHTRAPPPFVGLLSHKLFRLVLKSRICSFQSILACRGSQKLHLGDLGLTQINRLICIIYIFCWNSC